MVRRTLLLTTLALAAATLGVGVPAHAVDIADPSDVERATDLRLAIEALDVSDPEAVAESVERLAELPPEDHVAMLRAFAAVLTTFDSPSHAELLDDVLSRLGSSAVRALLDQLASAEATREDRILLFWYSRTSPKGAGLDVVVRACASAPELEQNSHATRSMMRDSVIAEMRHGKHDLASVAKGFHDLPAAVRVVILDAVELGGSRVSTREMSELLGGDLEVDAEVLRRLARMPIREPRPLSISAAARLGWYIEQSDPVVQRIGVIIAQRFRVADRIESVLELLDSPHPRVAGSAHGYLHRMTGAKLLRERKLWETWLAGERAWMEREAPKALAAVRGFDNEATIDGLRGLARHPLFGEQFIDAIETATVRHDEHVRVAACDALGRLGQARGLVALTARLDDEDDETAAAASAAIARITGQKMPETPSGWRDLLLPTAFR